MSFDEWYEQFQKEWNAEIRESTELIREHRRELRKVTQRSKRAVIRIAARPAP